MTILSVNKTREPMGAKRPFFVGWTRCVHFLFAKVILMDRKAKTMAHGAMIAALYVVLTYYQNMILPDSATWAIQFRVSEALCILAFFTPAAVPGLTLGCLLFNISYAGALPLDYLVGSLATFLATGGMWLSRRWTLRGVPLLGLLLPAVFNGLLVGWELAVYIGGGFWINALNVAIGEAAVLLTLGWLLYRVMKKNRLDVLMFGR